MDSYRSRILSRTDREPPPVSALLAPGGVPRLRGDHDLNPPDTDVWVEPHERPALRAAAVLVPVVEHAHGAHVLLTRRADHLGTHSGQVAFPGGKIDPGETPAEAALREAGMRSARGAAGTRNMSVGFSRRNWRPASEIDSPRPCRCRRLSRRL